VVVRILAALFLVTACWSQQPEFEPASIKPAAPSQTGSNFNRMAGGGIRATNVSLKDLVLFAYDIREQQLVSGPAWMDKITYDVVAKPSENDNPTGVKRSFDEEFRGIRLKMRALLAKRFQLVVHNETKEMPIYALVVAKNGAHLEPSKADGLTINNRKGLTICKKVTMAQFASNSLTYRMGRTVVDKTGLTGEYDFEIKFVEDQAAAAGDTSGPDFLTAMREQIGLRLEPQKGPVKVLVIDRAEKASEN
jgi:uncharacterized protein (TIGR03435 family)